mgnify:FL=1|jgi:hypothetical protein
MIHDKRISVKTSSAELREMTSIQLDKLYEDLRVLQFQAQYIILSRGGE